MYPISETERNRRTAQSQRDLEVKLATREAAEHCGVSRSYLNKLRCVGGGPVFIKIGRRVVYSISDLDLWLDACRRRSTSDNVEVV